MIYSVQDFVAEEHLHFFLLVKCEKFKFFRLPVYSDVSLTSQNLTGKYESSNHRIHCKSKKAIVEKLQKEQ